MVASRLLIDFELLKENKSKDMAILSVCSVGALATHLLSYVNQTLWCWKSYPLMTVYLAKVSIICTYILYSPPHHLPHHHVPNTLLLLMKLTMLVSYDTQLLMNRAFVDKRPLQIVSVLLSTIATFYLGKLAVQDIKEGA